MRSFPVFNNPDPRSPNQLYYLAYDNDDEQCLIVNSVKFCTVQSARVGWQFDTVGRFSMTREQYKLELPAPDTIKKYKLICVGGEA